MQYQGGKSRIAKKISEVINEVSRWQIKDCEAVGRNNGEYMFIERERERVIGFL